MLTTLASCGSRSCRRWAYGETSTTTRRAPTAANPMPAGSYCRGPWRLDSTISRLRAACGAMRRLQLANGGAKCGRTGFLNSGVAEELLKLGLVTTAQLEEISTAWLGLGSGPEWLACYTARRNTLLCIETAGKQRVQWRGQMQPIVRISTPGRDHYAMTYPNTVNHTRYRSARRGLRPEIPPLLGTYTQSHHSAPIRLVRSIWVH